MQKKGELLAKCATPAVEISGTNTINFDTAWQKFLVKVPVLFGHMLLEAKARKEESHCVCLLKFFF
jgi:hypothetical protein